MSAFDAAAGRYDTAEPPYLPGGAEAGYERYVTVFEADQADDWDDFLGEVRNGRADPVSFGEFCAQQDEMLTFSEWCELQEDNRGRR